MNKQEVLFKLAKLDVLYGNLDDLDIKFLNKEINKMEFLEEESVLKQKIEKQFEC